MSPRMHLREGGGRIERAGEREREKERERARGGMREQEGEKSLCGLPHDDSLTVDIVM